ncbi:GNAT family N-acetyltransferase [Marilutibacter maris]|uniref:Phosphinothricin acetyltransferase protein n=1 Tax=Marilutibacter maris TaxID=1605891 RepID=A0A2U9T502_9GAMM|nr:GNAT family N-acetyltransferase [Lysobacter maris]AWV07593.1 phosphinothricin acetyltransferase protein [Lysobacter maris]
MSGGAPTPAGNIVLRTAAADDLRAIVRLLADDALGRARERDVDPLPDRYRVAFEAIAADPNNTLLVAADDDGTPVGVLQLTVIPSLTYQGRPRALIEGVRVAASMRGRGLGRRLFDAAIGLARERGCHLLQLTTDKRRPKALRFYQSLGFVASHEGMKLDLSD